MTVAHGDDCGDQEFVDPRSGHRGNAVGKRLGQLEPVGFMLGDDDEPVGAADSERVPVGWLRLDEHRDLCFSDARPVAVRRVTVFRQNATNTVGKPASRDAPIVHAALTTCRGPLVHHDGDLAKAVAFFETARDQYQQLPAPYHAALLTERIAACELSTDRSHAVTKLRAVADWFRSLGAATDAARCQHLLRDNGVNYISRRGRRGYGAELSPREYEVARLVADGQANREIAAALFLSPRTVERHVASVLRKLNVTSRATLRDSWDDKA